MLCFLHALCVAALHGMAATLRHIHQSASLLSHFITLHRPMPCVIKYYDLFKISIQKLAMNSFMWQTTLQNVTTRL